MISIIFLILWIKEAGKESWRSAKVLKPSRLQPDWDQTEYWEESWRREETCCHLDFSDDILLVQVRKLILNKIIMMIMMMTLMVYTLSLRKLCWKKYKPLFAIVGVVKIKNSICHCLRTKMKEDVTFKWQGHS